jgi:hypothetical protein
VSLSSQASGTWNEGHVGAFNELAGSDDEYAFFSALDLFEQKLIDYFNTYLRSPGGNPLTAVFDRTKLLPVGFAAGGAFTYRIAAVAPSYNWTVPAACVFSSTMGGWRTEDDRIAAPTAPQVKWLPAVPCSLLHICGTQDSICPPTVDGPSGDEAAAVVAQGLLTGPWARADISGLNSALEYVALANAQPGWAAAPAAPPTAIPTTYGAAATIFDTASWDTTGGATPNLQVCCARVDMQNLLPPFAPAAVVEFFRTWGGL